MNTVALTDAPLAALPQWQALRSHRAALVGFDMRDAFAADGQRSQRFSRALEHAEASLRLDYSRNLIDAHGMELLLALADARGLRARIEAMFSGERINRTEHRSVLHVALRDLTSAPLELDGGDLKPAIAAVRERFLSFAEDVRQGRWLGYAGRDVGLRITDVVNIGIGGSDLGPLMVVEALRPYHDGPRVHFVSNVDGAHLSSTLLGLNAASTLFIIASKTFTTIETMSNARSARRWLVDALGSEVAVARHFVAVSTNGSAVAAFGIDAEAMFPFWDWVGGRYSLWSSVGVSIALAVGRARFVQLLAGAHAMDVHFRTAPFSDNLPVLMGLLGIWYVNLWNCGSHCIAPYYQHLSRFAAHIQQVDMESNGKRVTASGEPVGMATGPVVWGEPGTNGQHAYFQLLHQGPALIPVDFLLAARSSYPMDDHHTILSANCLAQSQALMAGKSSAEVEKDLRIGGMNSVDAARQAPHRECPGNRPSNTLLVRQWDPHTVGMLTALYEHKVFVQGAIWGINSFDQWGVELGKKVASLLLPALAGEASSGVDAATAALIDHWRGLRDQPPGSATI